MGVLMLILVLSNGEHRHTLHALHMCQFVPDMNKPVYCQFRLLPIFWTLEASGRNRSVFSPPGKASYRTLLLARLQDGEFVISVTE